jgi:hypothetical protein
MFVEPTPNKCYAIVPVRRAVHLNAHTNCMMRRELNDSGLVTDCSKTISLVAGNAIETGRLIFICEQQLDKPSPRRLRRRPFGSVPSGEVTVQVVGLAVDQLASAKPKPRLVRRPVAFTARLHSDEPVRGRP